MVTANLAIITLVKPQSSQYVKFITHTSETVRGAMERRAARRRKGRRLRAPPQLAQKTSIRISCLKHFSTSEGKEEWRAHPEFSLQSSCFFTHGVPNV